MNNQKERGLGKKLIAVLTMTVFLLGVLVQPALALDFGVYTASTTTNYLNPDTGVTEDGGTQNVELGEGMCRSAVDKTALIEVDADGNVYVTVRMLLYSNLSKIKFYTQAKSGGSYSAASASITAENAANDSADFRFKVPKAGCNVKTTMYVAPMGRDVTFFWNVNSGTAKAGSGDFVVNIDLNAKPKAEEPAPAPAKAATPAKSEAAQPAASSASHTDTAKANTSSSNANSSNTSSNSSTMKADTNTAAAQTSSNSSSAANTDSKTDAAVKADNQAANHEPANDSQEEELQEVEGIPVDENGDAEDDGNDGEAAEPEDEAGVDADAEDGEEAEQAEGSVPVVPIVCVVVVVVAAAGYFVMKRK